MMHYSIQKAIYDKGYSIYDDIYGKHDKVEQDFTLEIQYYQTMGDFQFQNETVEQYETISQEYEQQTAETQYRRTYNNIQYNSQNNLNNQIQSLEQNDNNPQSDIQQSNEDYSSNNNRLGFFQSIEMHHHQHGSQQFNELENHDSTFQPGQQEQEDQLLLQQDQLQSQEQGSNLKNNNPNNGYPQDDYPKLETVPQQNETQTINQSQNELNTNNSVQTNQTQSKKLQVFRNRKKPQFVKKYKIMHSNIRRNHNLSIQFNQHQMISFFCHKLYLLLKNNYNNDQLSIKYYLQERIRIIEQGNIIIEVPYKFIQNGNKLVKFQQIISTNLGNLRWINYIYENKSNINHIYEKSEYLQEEKLFQMNQERNYDNGVILFKFFFGNDKFIIQQQNQNRIKSNIIYKNSNNQDQFNQAQQSQVFQELKINN